MDKRESGGASGRTELLRAIRRELVQLSMLIDSVKQEWSSGGHWSEWDQQRKDALSALIAQIDAEAPAPEPRTQGEPPDELLAKAAEAQSAIERDMAEQKSLRQTDNPDRRKDLYSWTAPQDTLHGRALARIVSLTNQLAEARETIVTFAGPWAVQYAKEHGLAEGDLHHVHYDILEQAGARMDDFRRLTEGPEGSAG